MPYAKRKSTYSTAAPRKRARSARRGRPMGMRRNLRTLSRKSVAPKWRKRAARWNRAKRSIPNMISSHNKLKSFDLVSASIAGGSALISTQLTNIGSGVSSITRERNNIFIKGFSYDFKVRPLSTNIMPTFMRCALVVEQAAPVAGVATSNFFRNINGLEDNYINFGIANSGIMQRALPINPQNYLVIWSKTMNIGPLLEAGATSIQSNLNAQVHASGYVKYNKKVLFDSDNFINLEKQNVYLVYWFDDDFRLAAGVSNTSFTIVGQVRTHFIDT